MKTDLLPEQLTHSARGGAKRARSGGTAGALLKLSLLLLAHFAAPLTPADAHAQASAPRQRAPRRRVRRPRAPAHRAPNPAPPRRRPRALRDCWFDYDRDGYGDPGRRERRAGCTGHWVNRAGDCNDRRAGVSPGRTEVCGNSVDDNCDGRVDENMRVLVYRDQDRDGIGSGAPQRRCTWTHQVGYSRRNDDCDDRNSRVSPVRTELCGNGIDDDCDRQADENMIVIYRDRDGDGYGTTHEQRRSCRVDDGFSRRAGDCNDRDANISPGHPEVRGNEVDDNCDRQVDE